MKYAIQVLQKQVGGEYRIYMIIKPEKYQTIETISAYRDAFDNGINHDDSDAYKGNIILVEGGE